MIDLPLRQDFFVLIQLASAMSVSALIDFSNLPRVLSRRNGTPKYYIYPEVRERFFDTPATSAACPAESLPSS